MLPENFAEKVFQLEMNLEENHNFESIVKLNDIYGVGLEYFIDHQPKKAKLLHKKMTTLLTRPSVLQILQINSLNKKDISQGQKLGENLHLKLKSQMLKFQNGAQAQIGNMIEKSVQCAKKLEKLKSKDISKQEQQLYDRMLNRAKSQKKIKQFLSCKIIIQDKQN